MAELGGGLIGQLEKNPCRNPDRAPLLSFGACLASSATKKAVWRPPALDLVGPLVGAGSTQPWWLLDCLPLNWLDGNRNWLDLCPSNWQPPICLRDLLASVLAAVVLL